MSEIEIFLENFKTKPCLKKCDTKNNIKIRNCEAYHNENDKRRDPKVGYKFIMCKNQNKCKNSNCQCAHSNYEIQFHPKV